MEERRVEAKAVQGGEKKKRRWDKRKIARGRVSAERYPLLRPQRHATKPLETLPRWTSATALLGKIWGC